MPMGIPDKRQCPWAFPILPCGHSRSHMPCGHSQPALMSRGPPQRFLFQWRFTLPLHALWAFPMAAYMPGGHSQSWYFILCPIWHVVISTPCWLTPMATNMPCGHFPFCPVGIPISIFPVGIPNKGQCPAGTLNAFFFQRRLHLPWYALWAFAVAAYMPCGHSLSSHFILCPICPVVISKPRGLTPLATNMPRGHFPFHPALGTFPYAPWPFPTSANVPWAPATLSFSAKT